METKLKVWFFVNLCRSPGFGISLVAESTTGSILSIQTASTPLGEGQSVVPEDLGKQAAEMLLEEIYRVGMIPLSVIYTQGSSDTFLTTCMYVVGEFLSVTACNAELEGRLDISFFIFSVVVL